MSKTNDAKTGSIANDRAPDGGVVDDSGSRDVRNGGLPRGGRVGRRTFLKGVGATGAVAVGMGGRNGAVGSAAAIPPIAIGVAGSFVAGWALREFEILGADSPAEGLTPGVLEQQVYQTARTRKSTNASTIVDNGVILDGVKNNAYVDAKIAAIEELNAGSSQSDVLAAANGAIDTYETTIRKNLLKSWNESVSELFNLVSALDSHGDLSLRDLTSRMWKNTSGGQDYYVGVETDRTTTLTLPDGSTFDVKTIRLSSPASTSTKNLTHTWDPTSASTGGNEDYYTVDEEYAQVFTWNTGSGTVEYLDADDWTSVYSEMETTFQNVRDGISLWVTNVYGDVQSGSIEISELVTPRERAAMMADGEGSAQAIADLQALNLPIDVEREVTITLTEQSVTLRGTLGLSSETAIESGVSYDPATMEPDVYLTYDVATAEGTWNAYESGVDGGTVTFTSEPLPGVLYRINTAAGETATATEADFSESSGTWTVDLSEQLETPITTVESVGYYSEQEGTQYETVKLSGPFTVDKIENTETGEEATSLNFETTEPQTDSNYITQEEWDQLEQKNQELIEKYEESQGGGGLFGGGGWPALGDAGPAALAAGVGVSLGVLALLREVAKLYLPGR